MHKATTTIIALLTIATILPAANAANPDHAPVACVDGTLVTAYNGQTYDPSGVTGSGTQADPYTLQNVQIDLVAYKTYPAGVVIVNCDHFRINHVQTYGDIGRTPACPPSLPGSLQPGEVANFGVMALQSDDVLIENSIIKGARRAGISFDQSNGIVRWSDVKMNYGGGIYARNASSVNITENVIAYNWGYMQPDAETYPADWPSTHTEYGDQYPETIYITAPVYAELGAHVDIYNNTLYRPASIIIIDKDRDVSTSATINLNNFSLLDGVGVIEGAYDDDGDGIGTGPPHNAMVGTCSTRTWSSRDSEIFGVEAYRTSAAWRGPSASAPGVPDPAAGYDYTKDPAHTVNARLNFWGTMTALGAPTASQAQGKVDVMLPLPVAPPATILTGAAHQFGIPLRSTQVLVSQTAPSI